MVFQNSLPIVEEDDCLRGCRNFLAQLQDSRLFRPIAISASEPETMTIHQYQAKPIVLLWVLTLLPEVEFAGDPK